MKKNPLLIQSDIDKILDDAWLNIVVNPKTLFNPLGYIPPELENEPHLYILWLLSRPEYFSFFCSEILNIRILPFQAVILRELWVRKFPMLIASRGGGKSYLLALYSILRMIFLPGRRIILCGAGFRQSKIIFQYMETIWKNAPLLRDMVGTQGNGASHEPDMYSFKIGDSTTLAIPIGTGEKIRGLRANDILNDEFSSINREIFETVIGGFGVVASNPIEVVQEEAKKKINKRLSHKIETKELLPSDNVPNQIIFSGTAYYQFNHFYEYWKKWKAIIKSGGNQSKLEEIFGEEGVPPAFNWKDYSIIRIPYDILPQGLMDDGIIARAKATVNSGVFENEYGAVFSSDSNGFFKRSLIESCVPSNNNQIKLPSGKIDFEPLLVGNSSKKYVFGVDPASEVDNFSIVVLEINRDHRRIVYVWTTTRKSHREALKSGIVEETDYYGYCAAKIRELMKKFPCQHIAMDSQGGGIAVSEALHDLNRLKNDELPIWPIIDPAKEKDTDGESGLHILELVNFASYDWVSEANHGLKKDFEDKICLFPRFDSATIGLSVLEDAIGGHSNGSKLEELIYEIEELKNELAIIVITKTDTGRDRWDTPEVKVSGNKKGRMRKDRYSALLMANMSARKTYLKPMRDKPMTTGGFANSGKLDVNGPEFIGPAWFTENMRNVY